MFVWSQRIWSLGILGAFTFLIAIITLGIFGVLTPSEISSGIANVQVAVIIMLLLLGDVLRNTGLIENVFDRLFSSAKTYKGFLSRMMVIVSFFSAFLNNTPLVAVMMPYVHSWCKRNNFSPSKFLIPLSYAAILGGSVTLIGTSTNLIVNGMVVEQKGRLGGLETLQFYDFIYVGIPMVIIGFIYLITIGEKLLPDKRIALDDIHESTREYLVSAKVRNNSRLIGKTIEQTGLQNFKGLYLVEIIKRGDVHIVPALDTILENDDILIFAGATNDIAELIDANTGLVLPEVGMLSKMKRAEVVEIIVSQNSSLINKKVKEVNFRAKFDAAVIAVHRNGETIHVQLGDIVLKAGDVLLVYAGEDFDSRTQPSTDFYFMTKIKGFIKYEWYKIAILFGGTLLAIFLSAIHVVSLFMGLIIVLVTSLVLKIANPKELPKSIDYNLALIIVLSLALGTAMIKTNTADLMANSIISVFMPLGKVWVLLSIYLITTVLAAYITNKASVAIIFPIAITVAQNLELNPLPFVLTVAYASAANFMTPHGYQTNLMVYGPGRYSFKDFFKIGFPLTILYMLVTVTILSLMYF